MKKQRFFDYKEYVDCLENSKYESKQGRYKEFEKYERLSGVSRDTPLEKHPFFIRHVSKFKIPYKFKPNIFLDNSNSSPKDLKLLTQLALASLSCETQLEAEKGDDGKSLLRVSISVQNNKGETANGYLDDLWPTQLLELFRIYVAEQVNLYILEEEDEDRDCFKTERNVQYKAYLEQMENIHEEIALNKVDGIEEFLSESTKT